MLVEPVQVPGACLAVIGPDRLLHAGEDDAVMDVLGLVLRPDVPVAIGRVRVAARALEPGVVRRGVVDDEVDQHPQAPVLRGAGEGDEVAQCAEPWVDRVVVGDVVAVVAVRAGKEGQQPDAGGAERLDVVEPVRQSAEVADPVAVRVHVGVDVDAVDDGVLVPEVEHALRSSSIRARPAIRSWRRGRWKIPGAPRRTYSGRRGGSS